MNAFAAGLNHLYAYNPNNFLRRGSGKYPNRFNTKLYYQMVGPNGDFSVNSNIGHFEDRDRPKIEKNPVLIFVARYDRVAKPALIVKHKDYCPQAQFELFDFSGHHPQIEELTKTFWLHQAIS